MEPHWRSLGVGLENFIAGPYLPSVLCLLSDKAMSLVISSCCAALPTTRNCSQMISQNESSLPEAVLCQKEMQLMKPGLVPDYPHPGTGPSAFPGGWSLSRSVPWVKVTQASIASLSLFPVLSLVSSRLEQISV